MAERFVTAGTTLIAEGDTVVHLYELRSGTIEVTRDDVTVAVVRDQGAIFGEISLLLGRPASAPVKAATDAAVVEVENAHERLASEHEFAVGLARLLARRLDTMTGYLVDLRQQYSDHGGGLGMIDEVLASLSHAPDVAFEPGSEREPDPPY